MIPNYYEILGINPDADENQIRQAYKKQSLLTHPDRMANATEAQRLEATKKFQTVADAYYVLSDTGRRRAYDAQRPSQSRGYAGASTGAAPGGFPGGFYDNSDSASASFFESFFRKGGPGSEFADEDVRSDDSDEGSTSARPNAEHVFGDVFEELLHPEVERVMPFWKWIGAASGAALGFIAGNLPGAAIGAYTGGKFGSIRDAKGKAVVAVFRDLGGDQKAAILQGLLKKVVGSVTSL